MGWIFAVIICVVFPVGFGTILMSITEKIESIFGIDKHISELHKKVNNLEDEINRMVKYESNT